MALSARPLTESFMLAYAFDPAFDRSSFKDDPPDAVDGKTGEEKFLDAFRIAEERLDYEPLIKQGDRPTLFIFRPLRDDESRRIAGLSPDNATLYSLCVRVCLERVENGGEKLERVKRERDPELEGFGQVVSVDYMNFLGAMSRAMGRALGEITNQLGHEVFRRSVNLRPPS